MKTLLIVTLFGLGVIAGTPTFAVAHDDSKPLTLPDFSTVTSARTGKPKVKLNSNCGAGENQNVIPGQSGFERCMPQDIRLKEGVNR